MSPATLRGAIHQVTRSRKPFTGAARVTGVGRRGYSYTRVSLVAEVLRGRNDLRPADAVKVSLPGPDGRPPAVPEYTDKGVRWPDGASVPVMRTLTISAFEPQSGSVEFDVLDHGYGALSAWLSTVRAGQTIAVSGPRCDFEVPVGIAEWLIVADPSALPAAAAIIGALPGGLSVRAIAETADERDRSILPPYPGLTVRCTGLRPGS